jgi:hypothetical protein
MSTKLPRHIEEVDLINQNADFERPLSEPTASSYLIQRLKLADVCRRVTDSMPLGIVTPDAVPYEAISALDNDFQRFIENLPPFFQSTPEAAIKYRDLYEARPEILVQKYTVNVICQTRRCRLHQPFLVRGFVNAAYARSRTVCLDSARSVLAMKRQLSSERVADSSLLSLAGIRKCYLLPISNSNRPSISSPYMHRRRLTVPDHHMFFAIMALVMDICFNKTSEAANEDIRRREVAEACQLLEEAKDRSPVAKRFLESLMNVLRKHQVKLGDSFQGGMEGLDRQVVVAHALPDAVPEFYPTGSAVTGFEEIWQSYIDYGPNLDVPAWYELYDDLQTSIPS